MVKEEDKVFDMNNSIWYKMGSWQGEISTIQSYLDKRFSLKEEESIKQDFEFFNSSSISNSKKRSGLLQIQIIVPTISIIIKNSCSDNMKIREGKLDLNFQKINLSILAKHFNTKKEGVELKMVKYNIFGGVESISIDD